MILRTYVQVRSWETNTAADYDSALPGKSVLRAALLRIFRAEIAALTGTEAGGLFNDFDVFFDSIDIETLLENALRVEFPLRQLAFAILQHLAPRAFQLKGNCGVPLEVWNSILQGCKCSVAFTRALLKKGDLLSCQ